MSEFHGPIPYEGDGYSDDGSHAHPSSGSDDDIPIPPTHPDLPPRNPHSTPSILTHWHCDPSEDSFLYCHKCSSPLISRWRVRPTDPVARRYIIREARGTPDWASACGAAGSGVHFHLDCWDPLPTHFAALWPTPSVWFMPRTYHDVSDEGELRGMVEVWTGMLQGMVDEKRRVEGEMLRRVWENRRRIREERRARVEGGSGAARMLALPDEILQYILVLAATHDGRYRLVNANLHLGGEPFRIPFWGPVGEKTSGNFPCTHAEVRAREAERQKEEAARQRQEADRAKSDAGNGDEESEDDIESESNPEDHENDPEDPEYYSDYDESDSCPDWDNPENIDYDNDSWYANEPALFSPSYSLPLFEQYHPTNMALDVLPLVCKSFHRLTSSTDAAFWHHLFYSTYPRQKWRSTTSAYFTTHPSLQPLPFSPPPYITGYDDHTTPPPALDKPTGAPYRLLFTYLARRCVICSALPPTLTAPSAFYVPAYNTYLCPRCATDQRHVVVKGTKTVCLDPDYGSVQLESVVNQGCGWVWGRQEGQDRDGASRVRRFWVRCQVKDA